MKPISPCNQSQTKTKIEVADLPLQYKNSQQILENQIKDQIKKIVHHDQVDFNVVTRNYLANINQ